MKALLSIILGIFLSLPVLGNTSELTITLKDSKIETQHNKHYTYDFGDVRINTTEWAYIRFLNDGNQTVRIRGIFIWGDAYDAYSECPEVLYPGQSCMNTISFRPWHESIHRGQLRFALTNGNVYVDLIGWGVRW